MTSPDTESKPLRERLLPQTSIRFFLLLIGASDHGYVHRLLFGTVPDGLLNRAEDALANNAADIDLAKAQSELAEAVAQLRAIERIRKTR